MSTASHWRPLVLGIALMPAACKGSDKASAVPNRTSPADSSPVRAAGERGLDAAADSPAVDGSVRASTSAATPAPAPGGACESALATVSSCEALRALIAASRDRLDLRACLEGGVAVAPPPGNHRETCVWGPLAPFGFDCLRREYNGNAVFCFGDRGVPTSEHYEGFKKLAAECLAGWKVDRRDTVVPEGSHPGIEFERAVTRNGVEVVTHVEACKIQVNGEEVMAGLPPAYDLMINIFTTQRALDAGSP